MKNMKKFVAALLVLTMVLALCTTAFAKAKITEGNVKFTGTAKLYNKVQNGKGKDYSGIMIRKGSVIFCHGVDKSGKWALVCVPPKASEDYLDLWVSVDYVKNSDESTFVVFASGGSNRSFVVDGDSGVIPKGWKARVIKGRRTNVRKTASLQGKSLGVIGKGHGYSVKLHKDRAWKCDSRGMAFAHIMYKGKPAWVSFAYLEFKK